MTKELRPTGYYRFRADEGKVFDWANPEEHEDHVYVDELYLSKEEDIEHYVEIDDI